MSVATGRLARLRAVAYWAVTVIIAWEMTAGSIWDLLQLEDVRGIVMHRGYPVYVLDIIGVWKFLCAAALLVPRWPRLKEWAYASA